MPLPFSLEAPPPDVFAASKAVPLTVNIFTLSLHLQVITALPGNNNSNDHYAGKWRLFSRMITIILLMIYFSIGILHTLNKNTLYKGYLYHCEIAFCTCTCNPGQNLLWQTRQECAIIWNFSKINALYLWWCLCVNSFAQGCKILEKKFFPPKLVWSKCWPCCLAYFLTFCTQTVKLHPSIQVGFPRNLNYTSHVIKMPILIYMHS